MYVNIFKNLFIIIILLGYIITFGCSSRIRSYSSEESMSTSGTIYFMNGRLKRFSKITKLVLIDTKVYPYYNKYLQKIYSDEGRPLTLRIEDEDKIIPFSNLRYIMIKNYQGIDLSYPGSLKNVSVEIESSTGYIFEYFFDSLYYITIVWTDKYGGEIEEEIGFSIGWSDEQNIKKIVFDN